MNIYIYIHTYINIYICIYIGTESEYESEDGEINETYEEKLERENEIILRAEIIRIEKKKDKERIDTTADGYLLQDIIKVYIYICIT
jgi:hypothetical protein